MGKSPASLFYWGDVARDPDLRRCTHAEVGVWFRILCLMFEAEFKGMLATQGVAWTDDEIALAIGGDVKETKRCVTSLVTKGVASRTESGALINRRMYREHLERVSTRGRVNEWREKQRGYEGVTQPVTAEKQECNENVPVRVRAEDETEDEAQVFKPPKKKEEQLPEIPDWIPKDSWQAFLDNRRHLRSPMSPRAAAMMIKQLEYFKASGQDPGAVLDQSVANGWKGVFELKRTRGSNGTNRHNRGGANERVYGNLEELRKVAEASGDYEIRPDDSGDAGVLPTPGDPGPNPNTIPGRVQGAG